MLPLLLSMALLTGSPQVRNAGNTVCPVTGFPVTNHLLYHTVEVQGIRYTVYDRWSAHQLKVWPEGYLDAEGRPLNAQATPCACPCCAREASAPPYPSHSK